MRAMRRSSSLLPALAAALLLSACASQPDHPVLSGDNRPDPVAAHLAKLGLSPSKEPSQEIWQYRVDGYDAITDRSLIIETTGHDKYLVNLSFPCQGLTTSWSIGFTTTTSKLTRFDRLVIPGEHNPGGCPIDNLYKLEAVDQPTGAATAPR